jgi:thiamine biosynthesis lipoprotein
MSRQVVGTTDGRQVRVEAVMGTTASIDVRPPLVDLRSIAAAVDGLHAADRRFSLYRADSEASAVANGLLAIGEASVDVRRVAALADEVCRRTNGAFDARRHRADGRYDPTGIVKGWAVDEAVASLRLAGARNVQVVVGGDLYASGEPEPGRPWRIGIRHPRDGRALAAEVAVSDLAVATSGLYERGDHIRDPLTARVPGDFLSVTVVGPTLAFADAYATAVFAMGEPGLEWVARQYGFGALAITRDDRVVWTPLVDELRRAASALTAISGAGR